MADTRASLLALIKTPTPVRLWGGFGNYAAPDDDPLDPGGIFGPLPGEGRPNIGSVPAMRQLVGGTAEALTTTFTGVEEIPQSWVDDGSANGYAMHIGLVFFNADQSQDGPIWWIRKYIISQARDDGDVSSTAVSLTVESACAYRARAGLRTLTPASHHLLHPTDNFLQRVLRNGINNNPRWP